MNQFCTNLIKLALIFILAVNGWAGFAQVGFNNPTPHKSSLIDMKSKEQGLLIPRMTTVDRDRMSANGKVPAHSLLVFDLDQNMFFVYDTIPNPDQWMALNPFQATSISGDIVTSTTGRVGIGTTTAPSEKLEVNGNIKTSGDVKAANGNFNGQVTATSISTGNITSNGTVTGTFVGYGVIPVGGIILWSGETPPPGWAICNGQEVNGIQTPNLSGRFVVGTGSYSDGSGNYTYSPASTGGEAQVALTVSQMPRHRHSFQDTYQGDETVGQNGGANGEPAASISELQTPNSTNLVGGNSQSQSDGPGLYHENRPPFYALAYIMRVQ